MKIHKEGTKLLLVLLLLLLAGNMAVAYFWPAAERWQWVVMISSVVLFLLVLQFFRNPRVEVQEDECHVLAPADGKVVVVERTTEKQILHEERIQISIFMSPVNVHINRAPVAGLVKSFTYHPGKYLVAWHPKSSDKNECTSMVITMANGIEILVRQIAGAMARRIKWYVEEGTTLEQGQEFGFIKFGSRVDVFLPLDAKVLVEPGSKTRAGKTVLAELPCK